MYFALFLDAINEQERGYGAQDMAIFLYLELSMSLELIIILDVKTLQYFRL